MVQFTVEEENLICMYHKTDRRRTAANIRAALPDMDEDMAALARQTADKLDALGRVLDFQVVKERLCQWLEDHWDHRFLVWDKDPLLEGLRALDPSVSVLPCNPSAENMARYLGEVVGPAQLEGTGARLVAVEVEETAKCKARWSL